MKVVLLHQTCRAGRAGTRVNMPDAVAERLVAQGIATEIAERPRTTTHAAPDKMQRSYSRKAAAEEE